MKKASLFWMMVVGICFGTEVEATNFQNRWANDREQAVMQDDIRKWINKLYPDARILDRDSDNGFLEVKISHKGYEKIALFNPDNKKWLRTIWEIRREALPRRVLNRLESLGFALRYIDDNDNQARMRMTVGTMIAGMMAKTVSMKGMMNGIIVGGKFIIGMMAKITLMRVTMSGMMERID